MQRLAKIASPTASASSTTRISGSTWIAVEKASRTYIPLEYSFTGRSINVPISANFSIWGNTRSISWREIPRISPFRKTFSRPLNSGLKPAPSSSSAAIRPLASTRPRVGSRIPQMICSSVLFPLPFGPTTPRTSPRSTLRFTSRSAQNSDGGWCGEKRKDFRQPVQRPAIQTINLGNVLDVEQPRTSLTPHPHASPERLRQRQPYPIRHI